MKPFLIILLIVLLGCKKKEGPAPATYTSKMGGMRNWHGTDYIDGSFAGALNESFAITIIDDSTIAGKIDYLKLDSVDVANSALYFSDVYTSGSISFTQSLQMYFH